MGTLTLELRKERRTGVLLVLPIAGILGAAYAFVNFLVRKETLLSLPLEPMDVLLTQLYGMLVVLNMFGIIAAACMIYHMEFKGNAVRKMYVLPVSVHGMYLCKLFILSVTLLTAVVLQNLALVKIGMTALPQGAFDIEMLSRFALYSFLTSMPVLSFMLLVSSRLENMWIPLGIGIAGFLSGMALSNVESGLILLHPFIVMLKPALAMSAQPETEVAAVAVAETTLFGGIGVWMAGRAREE
ncbi:MAG: ABC transporter permease [Roseburia sp.]|nr:ABC transporter permease [Roseburia sp.]MCM1242328.1 ABC transporter permease [Roseburia sp.]